MAGSSIRDVYVELLLGRVRAERFPSGAILDRVQRFALMS